MFLKESLIAVSLIDMQLPLISFLNISFEALSEQGKLNVLQYARYFFTLVTDIPFTQA